VGELFTAPGGWRINWSFGCRSFAAYGGGNFKLWIREASRRLIIESVRDRWVIKAVTV
jgi:hypothetical protein